MSVITSQTGAKEFNSPNITNYSLFVGGVNATNHALANYSPAVNQLGRLFMVRVPKALAMTFANNGTDTKSKYNKFIQVKHMMEYMNRSVQGFQDKTLEVATTAIQGGFANRQFNTPTVTKENTNSITIGMYEMDGLPVFDVIDTWMNIIGDENSGLATYGGYISGGIGKMSGGGTAEKRLYKLTGQTDTALPYNEANHTAECIYVLHDRSGSQVERAVMLADMFPTNIQQGAILDKTVGTNPDNITYDITFNCVVYRSPIITAIANDLLKQYMVVSNSLNFNPELGDVVYAKDGKTKQYIINTGNLGAVPKDAAAGTTVGNVPVYDPSDNAPDPILTGTAAGNPISLAYPSTRNTNLAYPQTFK